MDGEVLNLKARHISRIKCSNPRVLPVHARRTIVLRLLFPPHRNSSQEQFYCWSTQRVCDCVAHALAWRKTHGTAETHAKKTKARPLSDPTVVGATKKSTLRPISLAFYMQPVESSIFRGKKTKLVIHVVFAILQ